MSQFTSFLARRNLSRLALIIFLSFYCGNLPLLAQPATDPTTLLWIQPRDRITKFIDDEQRVTLSGNRHPLAIAQFDVGAVPTDFPMQHMILTLLPDADQASALLELVEAQHNPESAFYHQWLTPEQYGERFGVSESDITQITRWLQTHGLEVDEITTGRRAIIFSGTAAQVESAFHTPIHVYKVGDEYHHANANDPEIPAALAQVVGGVVSLHDFYSAPMHIPVHRSAPQYTSGNTHYLAPADFATIYDLNPLYQQSISGSGQSIAIVARSNIKLSDIEQFRSFFGLPANNPQIIVNGTDPGIFSSDEETEADLDSEWSGAVAPDAAIKFVVSKSTNSSDGVDLSAQYIVNHNLAPVMSTSFGSCEQSLGSSGNSFFDNLWQQAAAQGISVFVSSGDSGAAGCDYGSEASATNGLGVNGLCSTPFSICVGGTEFNDSNPSLFWASSNNSTTQGSALSYIPEVVWNESGPGSGLWASGGGASTIYSKPSWQTGTGVPADGKRDVPDVSLAAAGHDGYIIAQEGDFYVVGGTSASSPSFAAIMSLVVQNAAARVGNANTVLYPLAAKQGSGGASVFHDITSGNNSVPGQIGFTATVGYDQATGLGSVDASVLVNHWSDGVVTPAFHLAPSSTSLALIAGSNNSANFTVTVSGGFNAAVTFSISGLPTGVSYSFTPAKLSAPGSGSSVLKLTAASTAKVGNAIITVTATSGSLKQQTALALTIEPAPTFTLSESATSLSVAAGNSNTLTITTTPNSTFSASIALSVSGLPTGMTVTFSPASTLAAPGSGLTTLTFTAASGVAPKGYSISLAATGGGITQRQAITLNVPGFSLSAIPASVTASSTAKGSVKITSTALGGFNGSVALSASGLPTGISASFSSQSLAVPGTGSSTLTLTKASGARTGSASVTITGASGSLAENVVIMLTVK